MTALTTPLLTSGWLAWVTDPAPADKDVKAGWTAFVIFLILIVAVALLCISFVRQLRKAAAAKEAGVFGPVADEGSPDDQEQDSDSTTPAPH